MGYAGYQSDWPEQTPSAVAALAAVLATRSLRLLLPVYDVATKEQAIGALRDNGLSDEALEQKCMRQLMNRTLPPEALRTEIENWSAAIVRGIDDGGNFSFVTRRVI
jgi:hypothetical protein